MIRRASNNNSFGNPEDDNNLRPKNKRPLSRSRKLRYDPAQVSSADSAGEEQLASKDVDMDVTGAHGVGGAGAIRPVHLAKPNAVNASPPSGVQVPQDEVLISDAARSLSAAQMDPQVRAARLAEIKSAIEAGTYDSPQRLEAAIDKMIAAWGSGA
jgi:anti-sigma28 factor (negative regulator of flagellin synthesis)